MSSPYFKSQIQELTSGSAVPQLPAKDLKKFRLPIINIKTQEKIEKIIADLEDKIKVNRQINQTLEAMAQALFKSWFVDFEPVKAKLSALTAGGSADDANLAAMSAISGKTTEQLLTLKTSNPDQYQQLYTTADLFPSEMVDSELGEIPKGWFFPNFDDLTIAKQGKYLSKEEQSEVLTNDFTVPVWGGNGVIGYSKTSTYSDPIVLMTCRGSNCGLIRFTISESWISNNSFACQAKVGGNFFLLQYFLNDDFSDCVSGSAQPQITYSALKTKRMRFPIETTVCCAYSFISHIFYEKIIQGIKENNELAAVRDAFLPKLLAGELL